MLPSLLGERWTQLTGTGWLIACCCVSISTPVAVSAFHSSVVKVRMPMTRARKPSPLVGKRHRVCFSITSFVLRHQVMVAVVCHILQGLSSGFASHLPIPSDLSLLPVRRHCPPFTGRSVGSDVFVCFVTTTVVCHISWDLSSGFPTTFSNLNNFPSAPLGGMTSYPQCTRPQKRPQTLRGLMVKGNWSIP